MPVRSVRPPVCAAIALALPAALLAQTPPDTTRLADLVVTAARVATPASAVPAAVTVVTGQELAARGFRFLADWLSEVPGAAVLRTGSFGGVASLFLRGGESDYTKVLVDGVAVNQPGGSLDFANLSVEEVERVEVVRGPASVLYGSDAVTGVIQIFTRGRQPPRASVEGRAGTFGTTDLRASAGGGSGMLAWSAGLSRFGSSGSYPFNNDYRSRTATGRLQVTPTPRTDLALSGRYGDHLSHFPTDFAGTPTDSNQYTTERGLTLGLEAGHRVGETVELRVLGSLFDSRRGYDDRPDGVTDTIGYGFASTRQAAVTRRSLDLRGNLRPSAALVLTGGIELQRESERVSDRTDSNFGDGPFQEEGRFEAARRNTAFYGQGLISAGPRADLQAGVRLDANEVFGTFVTWRTGIVVRAAPPLRLRAAVGTSFKQPTFSEQFARTPFETGNPDLDPERARSWEAGADASLGSGRFTVTATWFDQSFKDLIQYQPAQPGQPTYANVAAATARGFELGGMVTPWAPLSISLRWNWLGTRVEAAGPDAGPGLVPGGRLLRRPSNVAYAGVQVRPGKGALLVMDASFTGTRDDMDYTAFPASRVVLPGYVLANLSAEVPVAGAAAPLTVSVRATNLFGTEYATVVGFPGQGRAVLAGLRIGR